MTKITIDPKAPGGPAVAALPLATGAHPVGVALGLDGRTDVQPADPGWRWHAQGHAIPGSAARDESPRARDASFAVGHRRRRRGSPARAS